MTQTKVTYSEVKERYEKLRLIARQAAHNSLKKVILNKRGQPIKKDDVSMQGFDMECIRALKRYEASPNRRVFWDWTIVQKKYRTHPKRFEIAIWHRNMTLCGASIGAPTWSGNRLRLDYIEANPDGSPLDGVITDLCLVAVTAYAEAINASQIRIMKPVNQQVRNYYLSKPGFQYDSKENFCFKNL